jgi:tRNA splicing endonuclease
MMLITAMSIGEFGRTRPIAAAELFSGSDHGFEHRRADTALLQLDECVWRRVKLTFRGFDLRDYGFVVKTGFRHLHDIVVL